MSENNQQGQTADHIEGKAVKKSPEVSWLIYIAWTNLVVGILGAAFVWLTFGSTVGYNSAQREPSIVGILAGFACLLFGVTSCFLSLAIAAMGENLFRIRVAICEGEKIK